MQTDSGTAAVDCIPGSGHWFAASIASSIETFTIDFLSSERIISYYCPSLLCNFMSEHPLAV